jgi:hypothetical protein
MNFCQFHLIESQIQCKVCGRIALAIDGVPLEQYRYMCLKGNEDSKPVPPPFRIGDMLAKFFAKLRIRESGCGSCKKRKALLNRFGTWLYFIYVGFWKGIKPRPSKAKQRKQLLKAQAFPSQEIQGMKALKDARRQQLLKEQNQQ